MINVVFLQREGTERDETLLFAAGVATLWPAFAHSETEFQITCPGRPVMTVSRAQHGLSTLMWPPHHFQVASGQTRTTINNGEQVAITRFATATD